MLYSNRDLAHRQLIDIPKRTGLLKIQTIFWYLKKKKWELMFSGAWCIVLGEFIEVSDLQ